MAKSIPKQPAGLFDYQNRLAELNTRPTNLDRLNETIDWELFREEVESRLNYSDGSKGGRPPYDAVLMLKIIVLQKYYNLSEEETEFQILDRFSFQRFLGLDVADKVPDKNTIWIFKERLGTEGVKALFGCFEGYLKEVGLLASRGKIVDASFVEVPRQRNRREENAQIKSGGYPAEWDENPKKKAQKDVDARWMNKAGAKHYGYKNHIKTNRKTKLIEAWHVSAANEHDKHALPDLLDEHTDGELYADSAYRSEEISGLLREKKIRNRVHEKGCRYVKLSEEQQAANREKSRVRARVEHVFGFQKQVMKGHGIRTIGKRRAEQQIGLANWIYNLFRFRQLGWNMS